MLAVLAASERARDLIREVVRAADVAGLAGERDIVERAPGSSIGIDGSGWWSW
jgi:hypothetical protein